MVPRVRRPANPQSTLSVLALSSRFDGQFCNILSFPNSGLSVLALSSRFDGRGRSPTCKRNNALSVLALSSRFDGHLANNVLSGMIPTFSTRSVESF